MGLFGLGSKGGGGSNGGSKKWPTNTPARTAGGPVVKTGPTQGQVRSRNADGQWRAKRSDSK